MQRMFKLFKSAAHTEPITDPAAIKKTYRYWRIWTLQTMILGYVAYYFVRKNFSAAMPQFLADTGYTKTDLGWILTLFSVVYGIGKFANGILADRMNARYFMAVGLICAAVVNILFGLSSGLIVFGILWAVNAWFQSYGMPSSVKLLTHWYSPTELGTKWALQSTSQQIGSGGIMIIAGFLAQNYGWRSAFIAPSVIALAIACFLIYKLRDTPQSVGLPPVEVYRGDAKAATTAVSDTKESFKHILFNYVLNNKMIWIVALANIFVYIVRIGILDWSPTLLVQAKGSTIAGACVKTAFFELAGIAGALGAGWVSDVVFKGRRGPFAAVSMFLLAIAMYLFKILPPGHYYMESGLLMAAGFLVYGPQLLVPVAAADFATKKAAATATGMTGSFGYLGSAIAGVGTGYISETWGWNGGLLFFIISAVIGGVLFSTMWGRRSEVLEKHHTSS